MALDISPWRRRAARFPARWAGPCSSSWPGIPERRLTWGARVSLLWVEARPDSARFRLLAARLNLCPVVTAFSRAWGADVCAAGELGAVTGAASSEGGVEPVRATRFWAAGDLGGRLRWGPGAGIFVELEAGATFPFTRYDFALGTPDEFQRDVHKIPPLGWVLGWGVGGRIL